MNKATITAHGVSIVLEQDAPITKEQISDALSSIDVTRQPTPYSPILGPTPGINPPPYKGLVPPRPWPEPGATQYPLASRSAEATLRDFAKGGIIKGNPIAMVGEQAKHQPEPRPLGHYPPN